MLHDAVREYQETSADKLRLTGTQQIHPEQESRLWHDVLEVSEAATPDQIQAAYRRKIAQYHPDRVADLGPELRALAEKHTKEIDQAYDEARQTRRQNIRVAAALASTQDTSINIAALSSLSFVRNLQTCSFAAARTSEVDDVGRRGSDAHKIGEAPALPRSHLET